MKKIMIFSLMIFLSTWLSACSEQESEKLTRVAVQVVDDQEMYMEEKMIQDEGTLNSIKNVFQKIKWDPNTVAEMARKEDVFITLFYLMEENMPERLYEYRIWFNGDGTITIISNNENEGYGFLDDTKALEKILVN
jgi:hypothetical protein